jgi:hypothetical protein
MPLAIIANAVLQDINRGIRRACQSVFTLATDARQAITVRSKSPAQMAVDLPLWFKRL